MSVRRVSRDVPAGVDSDDSGYWATVRRRGASPEPFAIMSSMSQSATVTGRPLVRRRRWRPSAGVVAEVLLYLTALECLTGLTVNLLRGSVSAFGIVVVAVGLPVIVFAVVKGRSNIAEARREFEEDDRPASPSDRARLRVAVFLFVVVTLLLVFDIAVIPAIS